jgi:hypothetical protein
MKRSLFRIIFASFLFVFFSFFVCGSSRAQGVEESSVNKVDHVAQGLEKVWEKVGLMVRLTKGAKYSYRVGLLEKRLAELEYVVETEKYNYIEDSASRYSTYAGKLNELLLSNNMVAEYEKVIGIYERHKIIIGQLQANFQYDSAWWLVTQHDLNVLDEFILKLQQA